LKYHIEMYESTPFVELVFQPSVLIPGSGPLFVPIEKHVGLTVSSCSLTIPTGDTNSTENSTENSAASTLSIRAVPTAGTNSRILSLEFGKIEAPGTVWDGYELGTIRVYYCLYS